MTAFEYKGGIYRSLEAKMEEEVKPKKKGRPKKDKSKDYEKILDEWRNAANKVDEANIILTKNLLIAQTAMNKIKGLIK